MRMFEDKKLKVDALGAARDPETPMETRAELAVHTNIMVRMNIASWDNLTEEIYALLSKDKSLLVRETLCDNPHCPPNILKSMIDTDFPSIRFWLAGNRSTPVDVLAAWVNPNTSFDILSALLMNPSLPVEQIRKMTAFQNLDEDLEELIMEAMLERTDEFEGFPDEWIHAQLFEGAG